MVELNGIEYEYILSLFDIKTDKEIYTDLLDSFTTDEIQEMYAVKSKYRGYLYIVPSIIWLSVENGTDPTYYSETDIRVWLANNGKQIF